MLVLNKLSAGYGSFRALFDVSLEVKAGETVAVIGPNGAGKTTLLRAISRLIDPTAGDMIMAENYSQHAEHYQRIINSFGEQVSNWTPQPAQNDDQSMDMDVEMAAPVAAQAGAPAPRADRRDDGLGLPSSLFKAPAQPVLETA